MSQETQQWIPLTGPGGRLPTFDDADDHGFVLMLFNDKSFGRFVIGDIDIGTRPTHFFPLPKAPPLPKPAELTQQEKDWAWATELRKNWTRHIPFMEHCYGERCIAYGRSDGRAQLAREALGLFCNMEILLGEMRADGLTQSAKKMEHLHALLTKAAGEKP